MLKEKFFRNIVGNVIIGLVVIGLAVFGFFINNQSISANQPSAVYNKGASKDKVSLMINVYWGTEFVEPMLDILKANGVKTTFFVGGSWVAKNETLLKKIYDEGHEIGNHGYYHKDHKKLSDERNKEEILVTHKLVSSILGLEMNLFAPPSGSYNAKTVEIAQKLGYKTIMWSLDTIDWRDHNSDTIFNRATKKIGGGDLVLMHPTKETLGAFDKIIKAIAAKGLTVAPVGEVLAG